nr:zinc finger, CCHC-type [Tanacetum cinerariifolium]
MMKFYVDWRMYSPLTPKSPYSLEMYNDYQVSMMTKKCSIEFYDGDFSVINYFRGQGAEPLAGVPLPGLEESREGDWGGTSSKNVESAKKLWDSFESNYMTEDASSKKFLVSNFNNYNMVDSRPVMEQFNELLRILRQYTQHGLKMDESIYVSSVIDKLPHSWKDFKHSLKHGKDDMSLVQLEGGKNKNNKQNKGKKGKKRGFKDNNGGSGSNKKPKLEKGLRTNPKTKVDAIAWWIDPGATTHVCKDRCWFKTYEPVEDRSVLYMGDDHFAYVHGKGNVVLEFSSGRSITLYNVLYVPKLHKNLISDPVLNKCGYKQVYESNKYILSESSVFIGFGYYNNGLFMLNLNKVLDDSGSVYTSSSNVVDFSLWHACLGHVHYKRMLKMSKDDLIPTIDENTEKCNKKAVVRLSDPKRKTLGEKGIDCIFVGYAEHSEAYRFYIIEPKDHVSINTIIESRDAIFDENHFSLIPRPKDIIPNSDESQRDDHSNDVLSETPEPRKGKRVRKAKSYGSDFQLYLVKRSRDQIGSQYSYCYSIEDDPITFNEAMQSRDTAFLNVDLEKEVYMKQPEGFVMPGNEHKVCKLVKSLYGLKKAPKQWHQKFDEVVLSSGFLLNQFNKCVYSKFDSSGKGVISCLYVDDMLIFDTDQNQVDKIMAILSSKFSMKDMGEASIILGIKIKRENKGIVITKSYYIEKILKKFNREDCFSVSTPMDLVEKLMPNTGKPVDQLEYSRAIGCLMYAMTSTIPDIAYAVDSLSRFTSNPSRQHWHAITRVFNYLNGTMNYGLSYVGYPSVLEEEKYPFGSAEGADIEDTIIKHCIKTVQDDCEYSLH